MLCCPGRAKDFSFIHSVQTGSGTHPSSYPMVLGALSPGVKRPRSEADYPTPSNAEVKNYGAITPLPPRTHEVKLNELSIKEALPFSALDILTICTKRCCYLQEIFLAYKNKLL
jgi:hypothetical protein